MRKYIISNKGFINTRIIRKHKLYPDSRPDEFAEFFMPFSINNIYRKKDMVSFELLTKWLT